METPVYPPPLYAVDPDETGVMLRQAGLGALVSFGSAGYRVTHMPFAFDETEQALVGHMARSNPQALSDSQEAVVLFQGADAYVTPAFYPSKALHGRVAPTWNYEALHVHGNLEWVDDPLWLRTNVEMLTDKFEAGREQPWQVSDAPEDFIARLLSGIVGVRIRPTRVEARRKFSQDKNDADRLGVLNGLAASGDLASRRVAEAMFVQEARRNGPQS